MKVAVILLALVGTVFCRAARERRQVNCQEPIISNVCVGNPSGRIYFPHPTDNTEFLQCADGGRMFIIKCPDGEMFDSGRSVCAKMQTVVPEPSNLCTSANIAAGNIFFAYPNDNKKFIECSGVNQPVLLSCPSRLVYSAARQSCVLPAGSTLTTGTGGTGTVNTGGTIVNTGSGVSGNPCPATATASNNLFFPHPDSSKFIQCDMAGNAYVMTCPAGLVWNQSTETCVSPYVANSGGILLG